MSMEASLAVLNGMQKAGVIGRYAIGGAVAAFFYIEPGTTFDLDIFITWEAGSSGILNLSPIYDYLRALGYEPKREGILIEGWEVQFLPASTPLEIEALQQSVEIELGGVSTHVFTKEHLVAISLQTGRPKDFARILTFLQEKQIDEELLLGTLNRHQLQAKWDVFKTRFLNK